MGISINTQEILSHKDMSVTPRRMPVNNAEVLYVSDILKEYKESLEYIYIYIYIYIFIYKAHISLTICCLVSLLSCC